MTTSRQRLIFVRHGQAAAGWGDDLDPGLSPSGHEQAAAMVGDVEAALATWQSRGPLPIFVSPLRRTRETAAPLEAAWGTRASVEPRVGEIEAPSADLDERSAWLRRFMAGRWSEAASAQLEWRAAVLSAVAGISGDAVIVSHFVAINVVLGAAAEDDRVVYFAPNYCSVSAIERTGDGPWHTLLVGGQAVTEVRAQ